jgi:bifunctional UDP-N-acetylglucosamine pyrophosphorylase / glucosamine-1-phosphate N-acetyltransferase
MQMPQLGTGHAVQQAVPELPDDGMALVLSGDVPLIDASTLEALVKASGGDKIALLSIELDNPVGYGRIIRSAQDASSVLAIVEQKDGTPQQLAVKEIYSGMMAAPSRLLKQYLGLLRDDNAQKEFYLTDVVKHAVAAGTQVVAHKIADPLQVAGVNSPLQLQELEREFQTRLAKRYLVQGVRIADAKRFDVRGELTCGQDVSIDIGCLFEGQVSLADDVSIGAHCVLANCSIAAGAVIHPYTHIDGEKLGVKVGAGALVGPFARLRPGADLAEEVHIGNFVEVKNSTLAKGAKANHLAYLGDATVGERVNYGAGSITANYDGANKHRTVLGSDVHVGSNCVLVAPVTIGAGSTVGGGSTITKDVPEKSLAVARGKQIHIEAWSRPVKKVSK